MNMPEPQYIIGDIILYKEKSPALNSKVIYKQGKIYDAWSREIDPVWYYECGTETHNGVGYINDVEEIDIIKKLR